MAWGARTASLWIEREPGAWVVELEQAQWLTVRVRDARRWDSWGMWQGKAGPPAPVVFEGQCGVMAFAKEVLDAAVALERFYGADGYVRQWLMHELPGDAIAALASAVSDPPMLRRSRAAAAGRRRAAAGPQGLRGSARDGAHAGLGGGDQAALGEDAGDEVGGGDVEGGVAGGAALGAGPDAHPAAVVVPAPGEQ
jgi:hypothetical protein